MIKQLFTTLFLMAAILPLSGCSGEEAAPKKAVVDVKSTKPSATQAAAKAVALKAATAGAANGNKTAPAVSSATKGSTPAAAKPATDPQKAASATKTPAPKNEGNEAKPAADVQKAAADNTPAADSKEAADKKAAAKNEQPDDPLSPFTVPKGYRYRAGGRRDPFVNPIPKPAAAAEAAPVARPDGLPGVMVKELKVSGIVYSRDPAMKKAILAAGRKTYFAKQGDHLFDAVIKEIRPNEVVFTMVSATTKKSVGRETIVSTGGAPSGRR